MYDDDTWTATGHWSRREDDVTGTWILQDFDAIPQDPPVQDVNQFGWARWIQATADFGDMGIIYFKERRVQNWTDDDGNPENRVEAWGILNNVIDADLYFKLKLYHGFGSSEGTCDGIKTEWKAGEDWSTSSEGGSESSFHSTWRGLTLK